MTNPGFIFRRRLGILNIIKTEIGTHNAALCFQGAAFGLLIILSLGAAFMPQPSSSAAALIRTYAGGEKEQEKTLAGDTNLFLGGRDKLIAPPELITVQGSSLAAATPPIAVEPQVLGALVGISQEEFIQERGGIVDYIVEEGNTLSAIAEKFGLSLNTLLWANELNSKSVISPGQKLVILPVDGLVHHVKKGDTISEIAKTYQAKISDIAAFNDLSSEEDIYIGDILMVPGGKMPAPSRITAPTQTLLASSYFICPLGPGCVLTQGLHWYNAVDIKGSCGDPVYAAAEGTVIKTALTGSVSRWAFGGAGNHINIQHPNGVITNYGHIRSILVNEGQQVSQGKMIATVGGLPGTPGAGLSTGCHLHFGVRGAANPLAR